MIKMTDLIYMLGASDKNCLLAVGLHRACYRSRRQTTKCGFEKLMRCFDQTGKVSHQKNQRMKTATNEEN